MTGDPIGLRRLIARPVATMTVEAQEAHERREPARGGRGDQRHRNRVIHAFNDINIAYAILIPDVRRRRLVFGLNIIGIAIWRLCDVAVG